MGTLMPFRKVLIANRGEIAVRIARACSEMRIYSVGVYSDADRHALHVAACDEAYQIGPPPASESYLLGDKTISVALAAGCDAIHPGYGFLSENAPFAQKVLDAGLVWVGPSPDAIRLMGSKIESKRLAQANGVPVVPGYFGAEQSTERFAEEAERIGYPLLVKASAGGGGKGMRVVERSGELGEALLGARREALAAFGDGSLMLEKYLTEPRHIEVQVLGDNHGTIIHLGERECSIQRRHQKVMEECPSPALDARTRQKMTSAALALCRAVNYSSAGTVEFIFMDGEFYFLEMNTRLQVEHTVTEEALDIDIVQAQFRIAAGEHLWLSQSEVSFTAHSIQVRLYAEDPEHEFVPSVGRISSLRAPFDPEAIRVDTGVREGDIVTPFYDPMLAKVIATADTREMALARLQAALGSLKIEGVTTNLPFLRWLASHPQVALGNLSTRFVERYYRPGAFALAPLPVVVASGVLSVWPPETWRAGDATPPFVKSAWRQGRQAMSASFTLDGEQYTASFSGVAGKPMVWQIMASQSGTILFSGLVLFSPSQPAHPEDSFGIGSRIVLQIGPQAQVLSLEYGVGSSTAEYYIVWEDREYYLRPALALATERLHKVLNAPDNDALESPMPGKVLKMIVAPGDDVEEGAALAIIEAMKMEFTVKAPRLGRVALVHYAEGDQVAAGDVLVELEKGL